MQKKSLKKIKMPDKPGVYFLKKGKDVLYIGKATSLRDRVKSYFSKELIETRGQLLVDMVFLADKIDWQTTDTVLEALILEANLIKKHQPKYNTREKDDKSFNYVCITKEEIPKVVLVRGKELRGPTGQKLLPDYVKVFGPFPNGGQLKEALKIIRRIFPFLDEKSKNYVEFYRQINLVPDLKNKKLYKQNIKNVILFFEGRKKKVLKNLEKEMKEYAQVREFEKAGEIKRQIFALKHINDVALIKGQKNFLETAPSKAKGQGTRTFFKNSSALFRIEAYDIAHLAGRNMVGVMTVVEGGELAKNEYRKFKIKTQEGANDTGALLEVLERRFSHTEWQMPVLIVVDGSIAQINIVKKFSKKVGIMIPIVSVTKDEKHRPKRIMGNQKIIQEHEREILLANAEAHRFAIAYHKKLRRKSFLK
jgi:excinuclease ABC subunit C